MPEPTTIFLLVLAAFVAGFIDAVVGGGGLITIPSLLLGLPGIPITTLLGTNKFVSCTGTSVAATQFVRSKILQPREMVFPVLCSMAGASVGVGLAYLFQGRFEPYLRPLMVALMAAMLAFTLLKPDLGTVHAPRFGLAHQRTLSLGIAFCIGLYDGFFGPGTGSILIFLFVAVLGFDFLRASALAKSVNWASNVASVVLFLSQGSWIPLLAVCMAVGNGMGGALGARAAIAKGARWIRWVFVAVVSGLILRLTWQMLDLPGPLVIVRAIWP
ncbi:MAG: TSUP family transporter [Myxococcales bacterium]